MPFHISRPTGMSFWMSWKRDKNIWCEFEIIIMAIYRIYRHIKNFCQSIVWKLERVFFPLNIYVVLFMKYMMKEINLIWVHSERPLSFIILPHIFQWRISFFHILCIPDKQSQTTRNRNLEIVMTVWWMDP